MKPMHTAGSRAARAIASLLSLVFVLLAASCSEDDNPVATQRPSEPDSTWTYIVYDAADGSAGTISDNYQLGLNMRSSQYVNLIGLHDAEDSEGIIWRIDDRNQYAALDTLGEINTGSEETLYEIVMYAKHNYPADRYIVALYGHGSAYYGCCWDDTPELDGLRLHEIRGALTRAGGVDMVFFTAPCIMGCVEMAYELRSCTDIVVASEGLSYFLYWQYTLEDAFSAMHTDPVITPTEVAELIIDRMPVYMPQYALWECDSLMTMSAVRTDKIEPLSQAIHDLATVYLEDPDAFEAVVDLNYEHLAKFPDYPGLDDFLVDINSLVRHLLLSETDARARSILNRIAYWLGEAVFAECHHESRTDIAGLSIFLPQSDFEWLPLYRGEEDDVYLEFVRDTNWDELVSVLIESPPANSAIAPPAMDQWTLPMQNRWEHRPPSSDGAH